MHQTRFISPKSATTNPQAGSQAGPQNLRNRLKAITVIHLQVIATSFTTSLATSLAAVLLTAGFATAQAQTFIPRNQAAYQSPNSTNTHSPRQHAQNFAPEQAQTTWQEYAYGMQITLPQGISQQLPNERGVATFVGRDCRVYVFLKNFDPIPVTMADLGDKVILELAFTAQSMQIIDDATIGPKAQRADLVVTNPEHEELFLSQLLFQIDPFTGGCVMVVTHQDNQAQAKKLMQELIENTGFIAPEELNTQRQTLLENGQAFLDNFNRKLLDFDLPTESFSQVWLNDQPIGYTQITEKRAEKQLDAAGGNTTAKGYVVRRQGQIKTDDQQIDFDEEMLLGDLGNEIWERRQYVRDLNGTGRVTESIETGAATGDQLSIYRRMPSSTQRRDRMWQLPKVAYLSQADQHLLLKRLPRKNQQLAFYTYDHEAGNLTLMTVRVETELGGRYRVLIRRELNQPEELWLFDRSGKLIYQQLTNGSALTPSTLEQLKGS